jgi:hypothetical protein
MPAASEPAAPSIVEEEAETPNPGPSQTANASYNKFDFLMPNTACLAQCWMGKHALLAQGLEAIYSNSDQFIPYHKALEHAFVASTDACKAKLFWEAMQHPDANLWYEAAVKEMQVHIENSTWELVKEVCRLQNCNFLCNSADTHCNFPAQLCPFVCTDIMMLYEHKS